MWPRSNRSASAPDSPKTKESAIDFERVRALIRKQRSGEDLTASERAYLQRAQDYRRQLQRPGAPGAKPSGQRPAPERLIPLTDLTAGERYEGEDGGLYGGGRNTPPDALAAAAAAAIETIRPLDAGGEPAADGRPTK